TLDDNLSSSLDSGDGFDYFRASKVFTNSVDNIWGLEKDDCKNFRPEQYDKDRGQVLKLEWNKTTCDWVGLGIGWDSWIAKDLSGISESGSFVFDVRAIDSETTIPILIFILEDYSGVASAGVAGSHCLESYPITDEWQTLTLSFDRFDLESSGIDLTNIKQLVIECQGSGSILVDNMRIEKYVPKPIPNKKVYPPSVVPLAVNEVVFENSFSNVWGLGNNEFRNFKISDASDRGNVVDMTWSSCSNCDIFMEWGTSWAQWRAVDLSAADANLEFELKDLDKDGLKNVSVVLQSYNHAFQKIALNSAKVSSENMEDGWVKLSIPLSAFEGPIQMENIKQLKFVTEGSGHVQIDNIRFKNND
ncbi:MAG: hypothetical protein ACPGED_04095, partial [Flavobacteriales bacterium]